LLHALLRIYRTILWTIWWYDYGILECGDLYFVK